MALCFFGESSKWKHHVLPHKIWSSLFLFFGPTSTGSKWPSWNAFGQLTWPRHWKTAVQTCTRSTFLSGCHSLRSFLKACHQRTGCASLVSQRPIVSSFLRTKRTWETQGHKPALFSLFNHWLTQEMLFTIAVGDCVIVRGLFLLICIALHVLLGMTACWSSKGYDNPNRSVISLVGTTHPIFTCFYMPNNMSVEIS